MTQYAISLRKADGSDGIGPVRYLVFDDAVSPAREVRPDRWRDQIVASFPTTTNVDRGNPRRTGDILFFVHGFNVSEQAARRSHLDYVSRLAAQGWAGRLISYDWPSEGLVFAYLADRFNARAAASALVVSAIALLEDAQETDCTINVHVMAHSMGAFVVQQAFTWSYQDVPTSWGVAQLMLVAGDVDHSVFSASNYSAKMFREHAGRLTAYTNRYDKALAASEAKRLELNPRLGRVGLPDDAPPSMSEVNCSDLFDAVYPSPLTELDPITTHSFYFGQPVFWRDVVLTLAGGMDRRVFPTRVIDPEATVPQSLRSAAGRHRRFDVQDRPLPRGDDAVDQTALR